MKTKPRKNIKPLNKPTLVAFLLDRTGSMAACKDETIKGFNGYIEELSKQKNGEIRFTLTQFDSIAVDIVHDAVPLNRVARLTDETYTPRANTPLYDAIGKTVRATEKQAGETYKVLFVTLTDGLENASSEWHEEAIRQLIKEREDKDHWTFAHIGVGANGWASTARYSAGTKSASNVLKIQPKQTKQVYRSFARATRSYACNASAGGQSVSALWSGHADNLSDEE